MVLRLNQIPLGNHREIQPQKGYIKYQGTLYAHKIYKKHMQMTQTHLQESWRQHLSQYNLRTTGQKKIPGQLVFGRDIIPPINQVAYCRYIHQRKQTQINKYLACENTTIIDHDYRVGDKVTKNIRSGYKYKTPFRGPYEVVQTWTNRTPTYKQKRLHTEQNSATSSLTIMQTQNKTSIEYEDISIKI